MGSTSLGHEWVVGLLPARAWSVGLLPLPLRRSVSYDYATRVESRTPVYRNPTTRLRGTGEGLIGDDGGLLGMFEVQEP